MGLIFTDKKYVEFLKRLLNGSWGDLTTWKSFCECWNFIAKHTRKMVKREEFEIRHECKRLVIPVLAGKNEDISIKLFISKKCW